MYNPNEPRDAEGKWTAFDASDALLRAAGNKELIAPNGKKSNLTKEQYDHVRTKEFKSWFGDWENDPKNASKVIDENGEPKVMYHGTKQDFAEFDKSKIGANHKNDSFGFHFSGKPQSVKLLYAGKEGYVKEVFLNVRKPLEYTAEEGKYWSAENFIDKNRNEIINTVKSGNYDGVIVKGWYENDMNAVVFEPNQIKIIK